MILRIKFNLSMSQEQVLWRYINDALFKKTIAVKDAGNEKSDYRENVRIVFKKSISVKLRIFETSKLPEQDLTGQLNDLSLGGASCSIDDDEFIMAGSKGLVELDFLKPPQSIDADFL